MKKGLWILLPVCIAAVVLSICLNTSPSYPIPDKLVQTADMGLQLREESDGLYVLAVVENSLASRLGIKPGDEILCLCGTQVNEIDALESILSTIHPKDISLDVSREGQTITLTLPQRTKQ